MARTSLKALLPQVLGCTLCTPSLPLGPRPVLQIHTSARILIAGQAPGRRVHESGVPFDDVSGDRLRDWLGVDREAFYNPRNFAILPMGFCYPGTGKSGDLPPRPECAPAWREALLSTLKQVELTLVLGQYAQAYHLGADAGSVTELVQDWKRYWPSRLPLPHPSPRNQLWVSRNPWFAKEVLPALRRRVRALL
ncbi:MAG: uracil-DNA glycosylase family protein [Gemmatimonadota bacterium]|nr:uracil-DNA glycosylase family protein [Gemmatimonadota bacterium]